MSKTSATVEAFGYTQGSNKGLSSPTFSIAPNDGLTWCLEIYEDILTDNVNYSAPYVGLSLNYGKGSVVQEKVTNDILPSKECSDSFSFPTFISKTNLLNYLAAVTLNQSISVICEICASSESESYPKKLTIPEAVLPDPLELLFENPQFSDITLSANGTDFQVHKAILANQSQVFEAIFTENVSNRVELSDLNEVTLRELLRFIYLGKVLNLQENARDLLEASDKYALRTLKLLCETELNGQLLLTNALSMFILADMHSANQLKSYVKNFIHVHLLDVVGTSEWEIMVWEHPRLSEEILVAS